MRRPDGCTCGNARVDGHLPGCPVMVFDKPETRDVMTAAGRDLHNRLDGGCEAFCYWRRAIVDIEEESRIRLRPDKPSVRMSTGMFEGIVMSMGGRVQWTTQDQDGYWAAHVTTPEPKGRRRR